METKFNEMFFNEDEMGKCKVIAMIDDVVLFKRESEYYPYIIGAGFDFEKNEWNWGHYFDSEDTALKYFNENYIKTYIQKNEYLKYEKIYTTTESEMRELSKEFEKLTKNDSNLVEHFKETYPSGELKVHFYSVQLAGTILAGIAIRNGCREAGNLDGEMEKSPYTKEQEALIEKYTVMEKALERISDQAEMCDCEDEEDMEM